MDNINNKLPSIKQLQCFLAVAQELNFRRAAERLHMTQPPLTRHIKCLEETLGCDLFTRNTHEVHLTNNGLILVEKATHLINEFTLFMREIKNEEVYLRIGLTCTLNFNNISDLHNKIKALMTRDEIDTPHLVSSQLLHFLAKGKMDIVIIGEKSLHNEHDLKFYWLYREPLLLAMPSSHPASLKEKVSLTEVSDLPLFWFSRNANPIFYDKCENYFQQLPFSLKRCKEPDDSLVMLSDISRGKGMALMPRSICISNQKGLCYRELDDVAAQSLNIDVYAVIRKSETREIVINSLNSLLNNKEN
ncbi:LysR family transcriptional regulator [Xenorhabdus griffiniae]|uniref:LysR family transcriptional regulator n=1 Tax=Xenorhabdus griffiniae TaxID=351672 RepID=A0ABY9XIW1_9GAMM|nr:LysR family transcriptional regulator [Xenorhabdus griffiniae]MBD1227188.1 LysR family transcriptional regulator [Xenorhabdus griffiniae]MBE8589039.1 LysR family transcriptional regulator [Xenorhabdus griffiniae]WMV72879.1 LysR family transcriptional regulator [Xenorhabdus griffiniae]WNH02558.1 LysR family transcriptional regulator [Xenorhabdus griffiniae]